MLNHVELIVFYMQRWHPCFAHFWHLKWLNYSKCFHLTVKIIPPQICQKDQSLIPAQNVRTRTDAVWFWAGPGPRSGPKSVQSSPVLGLSLVLGPDLQTLMPSTFEVVREHRTKVVPRLDPWLWQQFIENRLRPRKPFHSKPRKT